MACIHQRVLVLSVLLIIVDTSASDSKSVNVSKSVNDSDSDVTGALPVTAEQLKYLANDVCFILQDIVVMERDFDETFNFENCTKGFTNQEKELNILPSKINFTCRSKNEVRFAIAPSKHMQLVVLVPKYEAEFIPHHIVKTKRRMGQIYVEANNNYTFWTTVLSSNGMPSLWLRGPDLPKYTPEEIDVKMNGPVLKYNDIDATVDATFEFSFTGEVHECSKLELSNTCDKAYLGDFFQENLKPAKYQRKTVKAIPFNDRCNVSIYNDDLIVYTQIYNTTISKPTELNTTVDTGTDEELNQTYSVTNVSKVARVKQKPEEPKGVTLDEKPNGRGWDFIVKWKRPIEDPEIYNLTLRARGVLINKVIAGNATSYTFEGIVGEPWTYFNISIKALTNGVKSPSAIVRGIFHEPKDYSTTIMAAAWSLVLTVAASILAIVVWWKRRKYKALRHLDFTHFDYKQPKGSMDAPDPAAEDTWELRSDRLLLHEVIGEGEFGVVRRGSLAPGGKDVAVKMLKDYPTHEEIRSFRAEMELMKSVGCHPHIVNLVGCCSGRRPMIVAEYCSRGNLLGFLRCAWDVMIAKSNAKYLNNNLESDYRNDMFTKSQKYTPAPLVVNKMYDLQGICDKELTPSDLISFCRQIAMGMEFLASNRVVHRDLAARNILVTSDRTLKITDFGLSRDVYQENHYKQKGNGKLPVKWMALESLTRGIYTSQSDVWSYGVVIWEIVTLGATPYSEVPASRLPRLLSAGYRMPRPYNCSVELYDLMQSCWQARPRDRPTFTNLHTMLDDLLTNASADDYLTLEIDYEALPPAPKPQKYIKMLLRGNRVWARGESYERPLKRKQYPIYPPLSNHYTSAPAVAVARIQVA